VDLTNLKLPGPTAAKKGKLPALCVQIGKYFIRSFDGTETGGIWIEHSSGEGMQCRTEDLEKLLDGLWDARF
jgi:hypothetical protein